MYLRQSTSHSWLFFHYYRHHQLFLFSEKKNVSKQYELSLSVSDYISFLSLSPSLCVSNKKYEGKEKRKMLDLLKFQE
jgi:hypothetical protein